MGIVCFFQQVGTYTADFIKLISWFFKMFPPRKAKSEPSLKMWKNSTKSLKLLNLRTLIRWIRIAFHQIRINTHRIELAQTGSKYTTSKWISIRSTKVSQNTQHPIHSQQIFQPKRKPIWPKKKHFAFNHSTKTSVLNSQAKKKSSLS